MRELGVQLVLMSRGGVIVPIAISRDKELVDHVGTAILEEFRHRRFRDEVTDYIAAEEAHRLEEILRAQGMEIGNGFKDYQGS